MQLEFKPDFDDAKDAWRHYWAKEAWRRPLVVCSVPKDGAPKVRDDGGARYWRAVNGLWDEQLDFVEEHMAATLYMAESLPFHSPDFGPDQFASFLSGQLKFSESSPGTNWIEPSVEDWGAFNARLDESNPTWKGILGYSRRIAERAKGRYLAGVCDLHSNADTLSALRSPERLCMDFYDCPEELERAMMGVRRLYPLVYDRLYEAGGMSRETGSVGWIPFWSEGKFASIQCDFICMVSPELARRFIIPALEEEASFLDNCVYHFDGPNALPHLDDILSIKDIDAIQWVPGDGQRPMHEWTDVLKKCLKAGKGLQIYGVSVEQVKRLHKELGPAGIVYCVGAKDWREAEELLKWLEANK